MVGQSVVHAFSIAHMWSADPLADAVMVDLEGLNQEEPGRFLRAAIEQQDNVLRTAPQSLLYFVDEVNTLPVWYDRSVAQHGCRVFLRNSTQFLTAFAITGRMINDGVRRLKQTLRHLLDIFHPRGVEPSGDG